MMTDFSRHHDRKATPLEELQDLTSVIRDIGHEVQVYFEGRQGEKIFTVMSGNSFVDDDIQQRLAHLTDTLVSHEISCEWDEGKGTSGTIRFSPTEEPWLDAESEREDWDYQRTFDDLLSGDIEWATDVSPSPS